VDVTVNVGGDSRAERFLGTFDQISRLSLDIDRNYGNKRVLTDFPLEHDGSKWTGTINKLIVGFDYTITGHAYKCTDCPEESNIPVFDNYTVTTLAGQTGVSGSNNGQGSAASFNNPYGVAVDTSGNVYVADQNNHLIRKIDSSGNVTTLAGQAGVSGSNDGQGTAARFKNPTGVALDSSGNIYVTDKTNHLIRKIDSSGNVTTLAGQAGVDGSANGQGSAASFNNPYGVAVDSSGNVYVADMYRHLIRKLERASSNMGSENDNHTYQEIFRGDTQHTVTEGTNALNLRLSPLLDDRDLTVPRITRINRPFQMVASTSDNITVAVDTVKKDGSSAVDATLSYRFRSVDNDSLPLDNITGGSFSPAEGDVTKSGSSYPDISTTYTAPDNDSTMKLQVRVSNELEIGVTSHFNVYVTDDIETQNTVDTNPVIENISAERLDNGDLKWTMNVSNDDGFSGLKVKWEYLFGDNRTFTSQLNTATQGDSNRGVMQATMAGYQDSDDGMLLVTVCEDGGSAGIPSECAYMNEGSTSISMELIPGAYQKPIICDGNNCSHDYEGTWIACDTNNKNPGGDDSFAARKETFTIGSGKGIRTQEYLISDNGACDGQVALTMRYEGNITDNGSKKIVTLGKDNVSASMYEVELVSAHLSFNNLNYIQGLNPDNETYLCGESYWTGVEHEISGCNFKNKSVPDNGKEFKGIFYVSDNYTLWTKDDKSFPDSFGCERFAQESSGNYIYPACESSSSSISSFSGGTSSLLGGAILGNPLNLNGTVSDLTTGFSYVNDVTTDGNGNLYASHSHIIYKIVIATGDVSTLAGSEKGYVDATGTSAKFNSPLAITSDGTNLYVVGKQGYVRKIVISSGVVTSLANIGNQAYGITTDGTNLYITNTNGHTIQKVVISTGELSTFAGVQGSSGILDGTGTSAQFNSPNDITTDGTNLFVSERSGHKIRKIVISSAVVSTFAGCGSAGSNDGTGTSACFNKPDGIATDGTNLYLSDTHNNIIRKIVISTKVVTTLAAGFSFPGGLTTDGTYLYVGDAYNHKLRKIE